MSAIERRLGRSWPARSPWSGTGPRALFRIPLRHALGLSNRDYAVSRDGQRFLVFEWPGEAIASPIIVVIGPAAAAKP